MKEKKNLILTYFCFGGNKFILIITSGLISSYIFNKSLCHIHSDMHKAGQASELETHFRMWRIKNTSRRNWSKLNRPMHWLWTQSGSSKIIRQRICAFIAFVVNTMRKVKEATPVLLNYRIYIKYYVIN